MPDLFIAPRDAERYVTADGLGIVTAAVRLVVEVTSPGKRNLDRDRVRKRREYARVGIPVYVITGARRPPYGEKAEGCPVEIFESVGP